MESLKNVFGYWILANNELLALNSPVTVKTFHIYKLVQNPELFGITKDHVKELYAKADKDLKGIEDYKEFITALDKETRPHGNYEHYFEPTEELLREAMENNCVRVRFYSPNTCEVTFNSKYKADIVKRFYKVFSDNNIELPNVEYKFVASSDDAFSGEETVYSREELQKKNLEPKSSKHVELLPHTMDPVMKAKLGIKNTMFGEPKSDYWSQQKSRTSESEFKRNLRALLEQH
jgi:hypothetical protein